VLPVPERKTEKEKKEETNVRFDFHNFFFFLLLYDLSMYYHTRYIALRVFVERRKEKKEEEKNNKLIVS